MGYTTRPNTSIRDFWPDDTESTIYVDASQAPTLNDLLAQAQEKWGEDIELSDVRITAEHIHTRCLGYDLHDPSDYDDFVVLTYTKL